MNAPDSPKKNPLPGFGDVTHQKVQIDWNHGDTMLYSSLGGYILYVQSTL